MGSLPKNAWSVHVTDYSARTQAARFTVTRANVAGQVIPGFYILAIDDFRVTGRWSPQYPLGLAVERRDSHGQIGVQSQRRGYRVVQLHAPLMP